MNVVFRAISYFRHDLPLIGILLALIGASVALNLLGAWPMAILVDTVLTDSPKMTTTSTFLLRLFGDDKATLIVSMALMGLGIKILQESVWMGRSILAAVIRYRGTRRLRAEVFERLQKLGLAWHRERSQGDTIYRVISDVSGPWGILDTMIGSTAACVTLVAMIVIMLNRGVELTLCALSIVPMLLLVNSIFGRLIRERTIIAKENESFFTITLQRAIACIGVTQVFGREKRERRVFQDSIDKAVEGATALAWVEAGYPFFVQLIFGFGAAIIMGYGGWLVYRDQFLRPIPDGVSCGDLMIFLAYLGQLWDPLGWVVGFSTKIQGARTSCERVFFMLDEEPLVQETPNAQRVLVLPRTLEISNVSFRYAVNARPILRNISITIEPGQMVAFVGPSGSGKSTLLNLLSRFYDPSEGVIKLDEHDIRDIRISDLRKHVAVVSQDSPLLPDTIMANLRYGRPDATEHEIRMAAHEAGAASFIELLPNGYDTLVSEGGGNLSGGQRQRLAIARALLTNAPILVLDEPTSALDSHHGEWVLDTLRTLRRSRTIILVTHDLDSVADCDRICVFQAGALVESGTHLQLLSQRGLYAEMVRLGSDEISEALGEIRQLA
jgi:ATP-binding cassette subfamily B protein